MIKPEISVIVPVFNTEKYLAKCVDSLLAQDFSLPYDIFLVENGSSDSSPRLCDEYAAAHPDRIHVIHSADNDVSAARNAGILASSAPYLCFADSDDHVTPDYLSALYTALTEAGADMAISRYYKETPVADGFRHEVTVKPYPKKIMTRDEALYAHCCAEHFSPPAWSKLIRRDIVEAHLFPVGRRYEDCGTTYRWIMDCKTVAYTTAITYYYLQRPESITHLRNLHELLDQILMYEEMLEIFQTASMSRDICEAAEYRILFTCYADYFHACRLSRSEFAEIVSVIRPYYEKYLSRVLSQRQPYLKIRNRLMFRLAHHPRLFYTLISRAQK